MNYRRARVGVSSKPVICPLLRVLLTYRYSGAKFIDRLGQRSTFLVESSLKSWFWFELHEPPPPVNRIIAKTRPATAIKVPTFHMITTRPIRSISAASFA
jgi:hypothetical protein